MDGRVLLELSRDVTSTLKLQEVLERSFRALRQLVAFDGGAIQLIDEDALVAAATDPPASADAMTVRIPLGEGVSGRIAADGQPIYIPDITLDDRVHPEGRRKGVSGGVRSYFGVPLIMGGAPIGVVQIDSGRVDAFSAGDRESVMTFIPAVAAGVQNAQLHGRMLAAQGIEARLDEAQQIHDTVVQGLSVAKYALESGNTPMALEAIEDTLRRAREIITGLLDEAAPTPGSLRRTGPALGDHVTDSPRRA